MLDHYQTTILLLEGNWRMVDFKNIVGDRGITYNTWAGCWNYIRSQQHKGVSIELTVSMGHTIQRVNELFAWYQQPGHTGGMSHKTFIDDRIMAFPRGCRGKTAELVLATFKSLVCVGNASVEDLMNVNGIGGKKAQSIYDHFNNWRGEKPPENIIEEVVEEKKEDIVIQPKLL
ncbi:MAG: hypothetical protein EHM49_04135 [Deltaproteobacteria bacterium]|nr:MAG: hypothetical protein EHM49_04135 [Deltaproteobacteria bacterium]